MRSLRVLVAALCVSLATSLGAGVVLDLTPEAEAQTRQHQPPSQQQQPRQQPRQQDPDQRQRQQDRTQPRQQQPQQQQPQQQRPRPGGVQVAEIPVQVGVGPAGNILAGPTFPSLRFGNDIYDDQPIHFGLRLNITAVIEPELVRRHPGLVPRSVAHQIIQSGGVRYRPGVLALVPRTVYLQPPFGDAMSLGATWSVIGLGLSPVQSPVRLTLGGSLIGTLLYIRTPSLVANNYLFARPGVELNLDVEIPFSERFLISVGWSSMIHIPQTLQESGAAMFGMGGLTRNSLWHIGQFYVQGHVRVPYKHSYRAPR